MAVLALPHGVDTAQKRGDPPGHRSGEQNAESQAGGAYHQGDIAQIALKVQQHLGLLFIVLVEIDGPLGHPPVEDRSGRPGAESPVPIFRPEHIVSL